MRLSLVHPAMLLVSLLWAMEKKITGERERYTHTICMHVYQPCGEHRFIHSI